MHVVADDDEHESCCGCPQADKVFPDAAGRLAQMPAPGRCLGRELYDVGAESVGTDAEGAPGVQPEQSATEPV